MKQNEIALLILITSISLVVSYFIGSSLVKPPQDRSSKAEVVVEIDEGIGEVSTTVFNDKSLNPTEVITIEEQSTKNPFNDSE